MNTDDDRVVVISTKGYSSLVNTEDGRNLFWTTDINTELPIKITQSGPGSETPTTICNLMIETSRKFPEKYAMQVERAGKVLKWTWSEYYNDVVSFAKSMYVVGVTSRKAVNVMGFNAPEWTIAFIGGIFYNCVSSGVYSTNGPEACLFQFEHSEAELVVVDSVAQLKKYEVNIHKMPNLKAIVVYGVDKFPNDVKDKRYYTWKDFLNLGKDVPEEVITKKVEVQKPGNTCSLVYTSGTTGNPKGVMLSHDNLVFTTQQQVALITNGADFTEEDRIVSYLPSSHIAGFGFDVMSPMAVGACVYYAKPDALQGSLVQTLQWARPTAFLAVPRVWEKFEERLKGIAAERGALAQSISGWAKGLGFAHTQARIKHQSAPFCYSLANFLILSRVKQALGLDQAKSFYFGAAPLKQSTIDYFASLDMPLFNAYGMSETTGGVTLQHSEKMNLKAAGFAIPGITIKIFNPDEKGIGEICMRGRSMMMGYFKNEAATKEIMDSQGYIHSGDLGRVDNDGFLFITGRIKELIITAGGENIAPITIEDNFKEFCPACSNIMVVGENQRFLACFITLKADVDMSTGTPTKNLTPEARAVFQKELNIDVKTTDEAINNEKVQKYIQQCIAKTNAKAVSRAAHIRKWKILPLDFSLPGGELTPTMKLKRKVSEQKYKNFLDEMYAAEPKL